MRLTVLRAVPVDTEEFVVYWANQYHDPNEALYEDAIGCRLTPQRVEGLFRWKNGGKLAHKKALSVRTNFTDRLNELEAIPEDASPERFLKIFHSGGPIWRIFWLHCWQPSRYPIFDQHVYRAAALIDQWDPKELPGDTSKRVIQLYLERYLPFWASFEKRTRDLDRALWSFGKMLKPKPGWMCPPHGV